MLLKSSPSVKYEIIYEMIHRDDNLLNINMLCEIAGVSRSGYYYWQNAEVTRRLREQEDERDFALILEAIQVSRVRQGCPRTAHAAVAFSSTRRH
jgi:hypothetical protein